MVAQRGFGEDLLEHLRAVSAGDGSVSGRALAEGRRIVVADVREDPAFEAHGAFAEAAGFRGVQSTPLLSRAGMPLGVLSTHYREAHQPTERELRIVDLYSRQAADFIERTRREEALRALNESLEELVEERTRQVRDLSSMLTRAEQAERQRLSAVLHDDLQQRLCGIQAKTALIYGVAERGDLECLKAHLAKIEGWLAEAVATTRRLSSDLSPPVLQTEGLGNALLWLQEQMRDLHGLEVTVQAADEFDLPDADLRILAFQIVRELLFNVVKHAGTSAAEVKLGIEGEEGVIVVFDQGCGVSWDRAEGRNYGPSGYGLSNARERLQLFGGSMEFDSAPGEGTRVTLRVPLKRRCSAGHGLPVSRLDERRVE
jgi:signal transduction histidine kinase